MAQTEDRRQQLIDMAHGKTSAGTMQPIDGGNLWRLQLNSGAIEGTKDFLCILLDIFKKHCK